ncbi:MAG TPA: hypothetical protein VED41_04920, partial [Solirubrobacteraceae bacterium]|nr:hypothetical protein [Solirubrobacteraceae bacterium]
GLELPHPGDDIVASQLAFCRLVTERTAEVGRARLGERYYQLDVNRLCAEPGDQLDAFLSFLGIEVDAEERERLLAIPDGARLLRAPE